MLIMHTNWKCHFTNFNYIPTLFLTLARKRNDFKILICSFNSIKVLILCVLLVFNTKHADTDYNGGGFDAPYKILVHKVPGHTHGCRNVTIPLFILTLALW